MGRYNAEEGGVHEVMEVDPEGRTTIETQRKAASSAHEVVLTGPSEDEDDPLGKLFYWMCPQRTTPTKGLSAWSGCFRTPAPARALKKTASVFASRELPLSDLHIMAHLHEVKAVIVKEIPTPDAVLCIRVFPSARSSNDSSRQQPRKRG